MEQTINYFRNELRNKLQRAFCGRFLPLWDDETWIKRKTDINLDYIEANDFLVFLYQTKKDICCHTDIRAQCLSNAIDKFFFTMFDFQSYFDILLKTEHYNDRLEIVNDIIKYKQKQTVPNKLISLTWHLEIFIDLSKKINEWHYWRKEIIRNFTKIVLGEQNYKGIEEDDIENLHKLLYNIELLFFKGLNS